MLGNLIGPEIKELIEQRNFSALRAAFLDWSPTDIAECIAELPHEEQAVVFRILPQSIATDVFEYLEPDTQQSVLKAMGHTEAARILNDMSADDRTALLEELPGVAVLQLLQLLSPEERAVAQSLLNYPPGTVGRLMTPAFLSVREGWSIQETLDHIRLHGSDMETLNVIYVTDERGRLIDDLRIREILIRPVSTVISSFRDSTFTSLQATDEQGDALEIFRKYDRNTLPVVDQSGHLLGIVTIDDMLDVQEEETTEDIQKLGGVEALEDPYMDSSIFALVKKRAVWLVLLFIGEMFTATAMGFFEHQLERAVMLALFIPLIISAGGNAGSQATSLLIRAMALGEVHARDWWRVMRREIASGLALGLLLGLIGFARIALWGQFSTIYGPHYLLLGATVGITVLGVVLWGTLAGSMFPILLRRLGLDPATSSAPFVATLVDVTGLVIYFTVALLLLRGTVL